MAPGRRVGGGGIVQRQTTGMSGGARLTAQQVDSLFSGSGYRFVNDLAKGIAEALVSAKVTKSQVRNVLNSVQVIGETWDVTDSAEQGRQLARLVPNLYYLAGRETQRGRRDALTAFADTVDACVGNILAGEPIDRARYTVLADLVEAVTAYHRLRAGGE